MKSVNEGKSGCYGKIPRLGDFITRSLGGAMVANWDEWLQDGISASRERLGDQWLDCYSVSPVWSFAAAAGSLDQSTWLGVMIPSVDRVGRYFPFSVLVNAGAISPLVAMYRWQPWFEAAQDLALDSLGDDFDPDTLETRLAELPSHAGEDRSQDEPLMPLSHAGRQYRLGRSVTTRDVLAGIANDALLEIYPSCSLWWTQGSDRIAASLLLAQGLPPVRAFSALLDGNFAEVGWGYGGLMGSDEEPEYGHGQAFEDAASVSSEDDLSEQVVPEDGFTADPATDLEDRFD